MDAREAYIKLAKTLPAEKQMEREEYEQLMELELEDRMALPEETLKRLVSTINWNSEQKFVGKSFEGMVIGGKSVDEVLKILKKRKDQAP